MWSSVYMSSERYCGEVPGFAEYSGLGLLVWPSGDGKVAVLVATVWWVASCEVLWYVLWYVLPLVLPAFPGAGIHFSSAGEVLWFKHRHSCATQAERVTKCHRGVQEVAEKPRRPKEGWGCTLDLLIFVCQQNWLTSGISCVTPHWNALWQLKHVETVVSSIILGKPSFCWTIRRRLVRIFTTRIVWNATWHLHWSTVFWLGGCWGQENLRIGSEAMFG